MAYEDWSPVVVDDRVKPASRTEGLDNREKNRIEYLSQTFQEGGHYSVPATAAANPELQQAPASSSGTVRNPDTSSVVAPAPARSSEAVPPPFTPSESVVRHAEADGKIYFTVTRIHHGLSRPKVIKTVASQDNVAESDPLALEVQYYDTWGDVGRDSPVVTLYEDSAPEWLPALELAPWKALSEQMLVWSARPSSEDCCSEWFNAQVAQPLVPLMDDSCPVLKLSLR